jgi:OOP family OmpA-OmpF porin
MRISSFIPAVMALVAAAVLAVVSAMLAVGQIERGTYEQIGRVLSVDGQDWTDVQVDGLQVILSGTAPDEAARFRAQRLAGTIVDASRVIDSMEVAASRPVEPPRFSIEILRNDAGISLIGLVPDAMDRDAVARTITELAGGADVTDLLEVADYPVPGGWVQAISFALDALAELPRSKISVSARRVEITAISGSSAEKKRLEDKLIQAVPKNVELILDISAPRPVITPFTLRFMLDQDGGRFDACSASNNNGRARILAAAAEAG